MTATVQQFGPKVSIQIKASESAFSPYERVKLHTDGTATHCGAGDVGIGSVSGEYSSTRSDSSNVSVVLDIEVGTQLGIAAGAITAGAYVYGAASGKLSATPVGSPVGIMSPLSSASGSGSRIEFFPITKLVDSFTQVAASSALTASSTETSLGSFSIPANRLRAGTRIKVRAMVKATATNSTDTLTVKLYFNGITGTAVASTGALDATNNDLALIDMELVIRTVGASGTVVAAGMATIGPAASATLKPVILDSSTIDTTIAQVIAVSGQWSTTSGGNSCRLDVMSVEVVG